MEGWGGWGAQGRPVDLASFMCGCLSSSRTIPQPAVRLGHPEEVLPTTGMRVLDTLQLQPWLQRECPQSIWRGCSKAILGVPCHREEDGPCGAGGHPGVALAILCPLHPAQSCTPQKLPASGIIHCSQAPGMGHVPGHDDQAMPIPEGDTSPHPQASRELPCCHWPWHSAGSMEGHPCLLIYCAAVRRASQ